jgi:hypothetical protein
MSMLVLSAFGPVTDPNYTLNAQLTAKKKEKKRTFASADHFGIKFWWI